MEFYANLKAARKAKGLTQVEVAEQIGVTGSAYCAYESGKRHPDVAKIKMLAKILGVSGDYLLGREEQKEKTPTEIGKDLKSEVLEQIIQLTPDELDKVLAFVQGILATH